MADMRVSKDIAQSAVKDEEQTQLIKQLVAVVEEQRKQLRAESVPTKTTRSLPLWVWKQAGKQNTQQKRLTLQMSYE